ncbi:hypothetical protein BU25DRAFT_154923 [Macroventuria anomochaeta]|uniref:Uncharacterized protein n=1 Tax=Macroventuria anomochaeta TaxID=301207 RepID=A0ACB6RTQ5_9PLEO|nr:uncharacterized protein BU25DRAFT_154923 [Macroventuria anomochaeta]KAF2624524.1 hypothetical protein BU25DRAFT_154923 [Macroventuria anomochaeta]
MVHVTVYITFRTQRLERSPFCIAAGPRQFISTRNRHGCEMVSIILFAILLYVLYLKVAHMVLQARFNIASRQPQDVGQSSSVRFGGKIDIGTLMAIECLRYYGAEYFFLVGLVMSVALVRDQRLFWL